MSASESKYVIETENLWRVYPSRNTGDGVAALRGVSLRIKPCQFVALRGRSGSGKTTLLNCLAGLDRPTSGVVRVLGCDLRKLTDEELACWRRDYLGLIFQSFGLIPTLSAYENVELILRIKGEEPRTCHQRTLECLELVGMSRWRDHRPYELSGGQQQRVAVARALANRASLILADEPTGELDSRSAQELFALFRYLVDTERITLLMVSHDVLVDQYAHQVFLLQDGNLVATNGETAT